MNQRIFATFLPVAVMYLVMLLGFIRRWAFLHEERKYPTRSQAAFIRSTIEPSEMSLAALVLDLKSRGLLDDTLVIWGGEFGRTVYCQGRLTEDDYGRDHHPRCFTMWMTGGGFKPGMTYGETDDFSYNVTKDPVHVHDLHATLLHCLGIDHTKLTFKYQGRHFRLTDVHGDIITKLLKS